jgi:hypothetical protein
MQALKGLKERIIMFRIVPWLMDYFADAISLGLVGAEKIEYLTDPPKSLAGTMAYNQKIGPGNRPSRFGRVLPALPLLLWAYVAHRVLGAIVQHPALQAQIGQSLASGQVECGGQVWDLPTRTPPFSILVTFFSPGLLNIDPLQRLQAISFLTELAPMWLIWNLEAHRRVNTMKFISLPLLFGVAFQLFGIGVVGPVYFFLHYLQSPLRDYAALDWRMVNVAAAKTALTAVVLTLALPTFAMYLYPDPARRLNINAVWQAFPLITVAVHYVLRRTVVSDTTRHDAIYKVRADLPYVQFSVRALATFAALTFNWVRLASTASTSAIFMPDWNAARAFMLGEPVDIDFISGVALFLQIDEVAVFGAAFLWLAYLIHDLKAAEMVSTSWLKLGLYAGVGTFLGGPGAVIALAWLWREGILATKKAKGSTGSTYNI